MSIKIRRKRIVRSTVEELRQNSLYL